MTYHMPRRTCETCHATLPRAAFSRCPHCREPILRESAVIRIICRRCDRSIPRAHGDRCPSCSVAALSQGRGRVSR